MRESEVVTVLGLVSVTAILIWIWLRDRRTREPGKRTAISGALGAINEVFHPEAAQASEILEVEQELPPDAPVPSDEYISQLALNRRKREQRLKSRHR
ncbi:MAG: hypothetical protein KF867_04155 [Cryobacterium sp.]|nr:hypothetical protein [Cryobacterium sp.]MBX3104150.1 hypothetical protein [Cryobacterium sp.]